MSERSFLPQAAESAASRRRPARRAPDSRRSRNLLPWLGFPLRRRSRVEGAIGLAPGMLLGQIATERAEGART